MNYLIHNDAGEILAYKSTTQENIDPSMCKAGHTALAYGGERVNKYVANGVVVDQMPITAILSGTMLSGLPVPGVITIEGKKYDITDGTAELTINFPGTYTVRVEALHHVARDYSVTMP